MRHSQRVRWPVLRWLGSSLYLLVVIGPVAALLPALRAVSTSGWPVLLLPSGRRLTLWLRSVGFAGAVAAAGMALGILVALQLWRWRAGRRTRLRWLFLVLAPIPPFVHAMAWSALIFKLNTLLRGVGLSEFSFRGWFPSWWVQLMSLAPVATGLALVGLESVNPELVEAAQLLRTDLRALTRVILPLAAPIILAGGGLLFALSLVDYAVPSLFQVNVYALDIFADFGAYNQPGRTLLISLPLVLVTVVAIILSQVRLRSTALDPGWRQCFPAAAPDWPNWFAALLNGALAVMTLQAIVPLGSLLLLTGSWSSLVDSLDGARGEIGYSLTVALLAALFCLPLGYAVARNTLLDGRRWGWWLALVAPLALPGSLVGVGLIALWNQPLWPALYGGDLMPVLAALARYTPLAAIIIAATLRRVNPALIEAASLLESSRLRTWLLIRLPLLAPGFLAAAGLVFCLTLGELSATLLVAPPGQATLTMRIYNYLHYGASETVAGLCLALVALVLLLGGAIALMLIGWARLSLDGRGRP